MDEKQLKMLKSLRLEYEFSMRVCNPIEFAARQQSLLETIVEFLLEPLYDYEETKQSNEETSINE